MSKNTGKLIVCAIVGGVPVPLVKESAMWSTEKDTAWNNQTAAAERWIGKNKERVRNTLKALKADGCTLAKFYVDDAGEYIMQDVWDLTPQELLTRDWLATYNKFCDSLGKNVAWEVATTTHILRIAKIDNWDYPVSDPKKSQKKDNDTAQSAPPIPAE